MRAYLREQAYILNLVLCFFICVLLEEATASSFCDRVHPGRPLACSWGVLLFFAGVTAFRCIGHARTGRGGPRGLQS